MKFDRHDRTTCNIRKRLGRWIAPTESRTIPCTPSNGGVATHTRPPSKPSMPQPMVAKWHGSRRQVCPQVRRLRTYFEQVASTWKNPNQNTFKQQADDKTNTLGFKKEVGGKRQLSQFQFQLQPAKNTSKECQSLRPTDGCYPITRLVSQESPLIVAFHHKACSVAMLGTCMLPAMLCSNGSRKLISWFFGIGFFLRFPWSTLTTYSRTHLKTFPEVL